MGIIVDRDFAIGTGQPGQTRFCQDITINDDNLAEGLEQFTYQLVSLNSELVEVNPARSTAEIRIQDDDGKGTHVVGVHMKHSDAELTVKRFTTTFFFYG